MKKFVRFMVILLLIVIAAILILGVTAPTDSFVSRSILIKAPQNEIFEQVVQFKNWPHWSPWSQKDTGMKMTYLGTDGQPGSGYHWVGNEELTGEGEMRNNATTGTRMDYELNLIRPWDMKATGMLEVKDTANEMQKVTWTFIKHTPFPWNAMNTFVNMDKYMGGDFDLGLGNLKRYVESHTAVVPVIDVKEVDYPAHIYAGIRQTVGWNEMMGFFENSYSAIAKEGKDRIHGTAVGLYYSWDTVNKNSDMVAAFPVTDTVKPIKGTIFINQEASKAFMSVEIGGYSSSTRIHAAIAKQLAKKGKTKTVIIEEYLVGPKQESDSNKWVTNIYYLVQ